MEVRITVCLVESLEFRVESQSRKRKLRVESFEVWKYLVIVS